MLEGRVNVATVETRGSTRCTPDDHNFGLLEAPLLDREKGGILFSDASEGGVWRWQADGTLTSVIPHRRGIGGMVSAAGGGLIVSGRNVAWKHDGETRILLALDAAPGMTRFNDMTVDARGRIFVGALDFDPQAPDAGRPGYLFMIDGGRARKVDSGIKTPNGIGVSPDGAELYLADTGARAILAYRLNGGDKPCARRTLIRWESDSPDGLEVTADGLLVVALRGANVLCLVSPEGNEVRRIAAPGRPITSLCMGFPDTRSVFVTSGSVMAGTGALHEVEDVGCPGTPWQALLGIDPGKVVN